MTHMRHEAEQLNDWVRYEAEYKGRYAHQLTEAIKNYKTDEDLKNIIVNSIIDRYGFYYTKESKKGKVNRVKGHSIPSKMALFFSDSSSSITLLS